MIFYLCSSFFFSGFTFYKEALCFIIFILSSLCSNMLNLENILEYIRQKLKKHAHFKISFRDEEFTRLFFFFSFRDEISSLSFIPGWWNFISAKTYKQQETFHHRQRWFHPGTSFIPGWNFTCKHPLNLKENLPFSMKTYNKTIILAWYVISDNYFLEK